MSGPTLFLGLALAGSVLAPKLPPSDAWVRTTVFVQKPRTACGKLEADGTLTPTGYLRSIQYVVVKDDKTRVQVLNEGKPVWVDKANLVRLKDAVEHYTKMLEAEPNDDTWFAFRGWAYFRQGKPEQALKDYADAIRLNPRALSWYGNRGLIYLEKKDFTEAIGDFTTCIDLNPEYEVSYRNRAQAYLKKKEYKSAATDFEKALELNPKSPTVLNGLAWLLCTCPDDKVRDGKRALATAQKACELTDHKNGGYLDTLAAAYAETGDFAKAVEWQEKALNSSDFPIQDVDEARKRLDLFKQKKAFRDKDP